MAQAGISAYFRDVRSGESVHKASKEQPTVCRTGTAMPDIAMEPVALLSPSLSSLCGLSIHVVYTPGIHPEVVY